MASKVDALIEKYSLSWWIDMDGQGGEFNGSPYNVGC